MTPARELEYSRRALAIPALPPPERSDEIDLRAILGTLLDHKRLIIAVTAICFLLGLAYVLLATPVYEATAMVQVEQAPSIPGVAAFQHAVGATNPEAADAVAILASHSVIKKAVDSLDLNIEVSPYRIPFLGSLVAGQYAPASPGDVAAPWLGLEGYGWGGSQLKVSRLDVPSDLLGKDLTLIAGKGGAYTLREDSSVPLRQGRLLLHGRVGQPAKGSGITMLVTGMHANPGMHFHVARNHETATINHLQNAIEARPTQQGSSVIALSMDSRNPQLAVNVLDQITQAYLAQNVRRNSAQAANSLKFVREQLPIVKKRLEDAQAALNKFQVKTHTVDVPMQTQSMLTRLDSIDASIQQLQTQKVEAARLYTTQHPAYKAVAKQIAQLQGRKAGLEKQMSGLPDTQRELLRLNGDVQVLNTTYTGLLNQAQQLEIAQAGTIGTTRIVDAPAVDVTNPVKPQKLRTVLGFTLVGGFLSVAFVFLRQLMNRTVEGTTEIKQLGLPIYASIPWSDEEHVISRRIGRRFGRRSHRLLALAAPADFATEALRSLRTSLLFTLREAQNNLLMICGSSPNAGKTFVSANLATVFAQAGQRVLLIDANMRDGQLHKVFGGRAEDGLSELIADRIDMEEAIRAAPDIENLDFVSCGAVSSNPSDLLMHPGFVALLRQFSSEYDLVILDSPPILAVTDAAVIGRHVGTCLLVVRYGLNQADEIGLAKERLLQSGVTVDGVIFNAVEKRRIEYVAYGDYDYRAA